MTLESFAGTLVRQRLMSAEQQADTGAFAQFTQEGSSRVQIGCVGIGGVRPDRIIDNLRPFSRVHMKGGFQAVGVLADFTVATVTDGRGLGRSIVLMFENAPEGSRGIDLSVRSKGLGLEFLEQALTFAVDRGVRKRLRVGRRRVERRCVWRNPVGRLADGTHVHVGWIVSV